MPKYSTAFGMDVHLRSTTVCALDADTGEAVTRRFPGNPWGEIAGWMDGFPGPSLAAYESGYLGFAPQRELAGLGVECVVAAVSKIPRSAADSASKNDRNDAARMAKAILAHDISPVWVPSPEVEGIRDLAGAYDGATARLATAKQRLLAFLAKRGFVYGGTTPAVSVNLFFTSFAKQARRSRKGGFTGCANVFSPIPVTARRDRPSAGPSACRTCRLS
ncbi:IS110 family transposase [Collinsella sp. HCP3S3_D1]|uniref:IS110 family transposase n=1 Tax=Collinsella sp. HCP3S3_D1 TaxID=3438934 RepID=UPI003F88AE56